MWIPLWELWIPFIPFYSRQSACWGIVQGLGGCVCSASHWGPIDNHPGKSRALSHIVLTDGIQAQLPSLFSHLPGKSWAPVYTTLFPLGWEGVRSASLARERWRPNSHHSDLVGWSRSSLLGTTFPELMSVARWWKLSSVWAPLAPDNGWSRWSSIPSNLASFSLTAGWV